MAKHGFQRESELASIVVEWLQGHGSDVYQEVAVLGGVADIVTLDGPMISIIECKLSFGVQVVGQAIDRVRSAHRVWVAVPAATQGSLLVLRPALELYGIGVLTVAKPYGSPGRHTVVEQVAPRMNRRSPHAQRLRDRLEPEHKTFAEAGTASGKRWTAFESTRRELINVVRENPGISMSGAIKIIGKQHYASTSSARQSLSRWVKTGVIAEVEFQGGGLHLTGEK